MTRPETIVLLAVLLAGGCAAGNPYRAEPIEPDIEESVETSPRTELRAHVQGGLLLVELERTGRRHWKERPVYRERLTSYHPGYDAVEFIFFPVAIVGYVALSPLMIPLDAMGNFTSYVEGYPDHRPWAMIETLATGFLPGVTTHFYDEGLQAGEPTGFIRGEWRVEEKWVTRPIGGARVEVQAPDGASLGYIVTDEAGHGALYLRNIRDSILPYLGDPPVVHLRVTFGGAVQEVPVGPPDLG